MPNASNVADVEKIRDHFDVSTAALLTEYRGLKVAELAELRLKLRDSGTEYRVLKNTLTGIVARDHGHEGLLPMLQGPTAIAFVKGDPVQAAKDLKEFAEEHPALVLKGGLMEGRVLDSADVERLSKMESREVLLARAAGLFKAQTQKAAGLFAAPLRQVATMTAALRDKRQENDEAA